MNKHVGSCLCGQVKFEIEGNFESFFLCHCKHCQKDTGSAHAANLFSTTAKITWITGAVLVKTYNLPTTRHTRSFCQDCGSAMPSIQMDGKLLVVPAGSLDCEIDLVPNAHIFCSSSANWTKKLETISRYEKYPAS